MASPGKQLRNWIAADETMQKLMEGNIAWANVLPSPPRRRSTRRKSSPKSATRKTPSRSPATPKAPRPSPWSSLPSTTSRILDKFETPNIRDPRDLLKHFAINIEPIRDSDVLALVWNERLLEQWKNERPTSYNEHFEFEKYTEFRLIHTLRKHKDLFEILAPKRGDEIVRIRVHRPRTPSPSPVRLVRREDINKHFPVIVDKLIVDKREGRADEDTYGIIIRGDFKKRHSRDEVARMTADLMRSLHASKYWKVIPPVRNDELCRIEMKHA